MAAWKKRRQRHTIKSTLDTSFPIITSDAHGLYISYRYRETESQSLCCKILQYKKNKLHFECKLHSMTLPPFPMSALLVFTLSHLTSPDTNFIFLTDASKDWHASISVEKHPKKINEMFLLTIF